MASCTHSQSVRCGTCGLRLLCVVTRSLEQVLGSLRVSRHETGDERLSRLAKEGLKKEAILHMPR